MSSVPITVAVVLTNARSAASSANAGEIGVRFIPTFESRVVRLQRTYAAKYVFKICFDSQRMFMRVLNGSAC